MRILKEHDERKSEIIQAALDLFLEKGYDACSVNDIINMVGIAKGTFYYYFKSKEEALDAAVEKVSKTIFDRVKAIAEDKESPPMERIIAIIMAIRLNDKSFEGLVKEMHKAENALLHQKTLISNLNMLTPIFTEIVVEGNKEGLFNCAYPEQCMQILLSSALTLLDEGVFHLDKEKESLMIKAIFYTMENVLGIKEGILSQRMLDFYTKRGC